MRLTYSGVLGIFGGLLDVIVGFVLLQDAMMPSQPEPSMMGGAVGSMTNLWAGWFLIILGIVVFVTGLFAFGNPSMSRMRTVGVLMLVYGVLMLVIGAGMFYGFGMLIQGSMISGSLMLAVGILMLLSGSRMLRGQTAM